MQDYLLMPADRVQSRCGSHSSADQSIAELYSNQSHTWTVNSNLNLDGKISSSEPSLTECNQNSMSHYLGFSVVHPEPAVRHVDTVGPGGDPYNHPPEHSQHHSYSQLGNTALSSHQGGTT